MRKNTSLLRLVVLALALAFVGVSATSSRAFADDRTEARTHYQAGVKFYGGGDYRSAIREFSAAQQLAPADLNNYNLALCYDKLGDAEPAIQYYRAYLDKVPNTDKRAEIDASVARLDAAAKSVAAKKAEEAKKADAARQAEEARMAAEEQKRADAAKKAEDAAKKAEEARLATEAAKRPPEPADPTTPSANIGTGAGSTGTPSTGVVSTGDAQLDRVQNIDINGIRDQRVGGQASGIPANDPRYPGSAGAPVNGQQFGPQQGGPQGGPQVSPPPGPNGPQANTGAPNGPNPNGVPMNGEPPKKETPLYKKWWFWAVVAVGTYVVYSIATDSSSDSQSGRTIKTLPQPAAAQPGGLTLMSW